MALWPELVAERLAGPLPPAAHRCHVCGEWACVWFPVTAECPEVRWFCCSCAFRLRCLLESRPK